MLNKKFGAYFIGWLAALGLFNLITFITPGDDKFDTLFWVAYVMITVVFLGQLAGTYYVFSQNSLQKKFYNFSLIGICRSALIAILIVGGLCMAIEAIPDWLGIIACSIVLVVNIIAISKAVIAAELVSEIDKKIKVKTAFIRMFTGDAQALAMRVENEEMKAVLNKVYEAARYSDPMSDDALFSVEDRISQKFQALSDAADAKDLELVKANADAVLALLNERNIKCKILK